MINQTDGRMRPLIQQYGCYFMSLLWFGVKYNNSSMSAESINDPIYSLFVRRGWMRETCFIEQPVPILRWLGLDVAMVFVGGSHRVPPDYQLSDNEFAVLRYKARGSISHFVAANHLGQVAYDPYGTSKSVREGMLMDMRVFQFQGEELNR